MIGNNVKIIINNLHDGLYFVDLHGRITFWNQGAERITGYKEEEVVGTKCGEKIIMHINGEGNYLCNDSCPLNQTIADGKTREQEIYLKHKDGHRVPVTVRTSPVRDPAGQIIGAVQVFNDNSSKQAVLQRIEELRRMVFLDPLTGLANRRFIEKNIQAKLDEIDRFGWSFGLLAMDIDNFRKINEQYGMNVGDKVLKIIAKTLLGTSRSFDNIGRWEEEEFVAIIAHINKEKLRPIANRFRMLIEQLGLTIDTEILRLTVSIGATIARPDDTVDTLIKRAEELMYQSKAAGRNCVTLD